MYDIVIPLRRALLNEELRYTVRSIQKNMPGRTIWFSGYRPKFFAGKVNVVENSTLEGNKYNKSHSNQMAACKDPRVSDTFLLFNDDFFVMQPITEFEDAHRGLVTDRIAELEKLIGASGSLNALKLTLDILKELGVEDPVDYGLHIPLTVNKKKWLEAWKIQMEHNPEKKPVHMRTVYGNLNNVANRQMDDIKISDKLTAPRGDEPFLSSNDDSFNTGKVGDYIREKFPDLCELEGRVNNTTMLK